MKEAKLALKITAVLIVVAFAIVFWAGGSQGLPKWLQPGHYQYGGEFKR